MASSAAPFFAGTTTPSNGLRHIPLASIKVSKFNLRMEEREIESFCVVSMAVGIKARFGSLRRGSGAVLERPTFDHSQFDPSTQVQEEWSSKLKQASINGSISLKPSNYFGINSSWAIPVGLLAISFAEPALAVTGVNNQEDLVSVLIKCGIEAFGYFLIMPPIILNWLRIRWYRRNLLEMYLQFMFVFLFFPGVLLWAPFLNFRKFPRDPSLKYPWSKPENPSEVKGGFLKYPWATIEDYE